MRRCFLLILSFLGVLSAQHLDPPIIGANIISDYSPRNKDNGDYDFHHGIDYFVTMWTDVPAVEGGAITSINAELPGAGYYIRVHGDSAFWTYMHLFDEDSTLHEEHEIVMGATLEDPEHPNTTRPGNIIIF